MLINDEGIEKMKQIVLELKQQIRGPAAKLDPSEEKEVKSLPF